MAEGDAGGAAGPSLVGLEEFEGELDEQWQGAKGFTVKDKNGDEIGTVVDVYVYAEAESVHLVKVDIDGEKHLVPVDAVVNVTEEGELKVEQIKDFIIGSPKFEGDDAPDPETSRAAFEHFGYPDQLYPGPG